MATKNSGPYMPNLEALLAAGIDPKTGLPVKVTSGTKCTLKNDIKKIVRIIDEQDAVNRYKWYNLPCNLSSQEVERLLYYKGQLCFFYFKDLDEFYFMPYALDGTIDFYGRFNTIHPVPITGGDEDKDKVKRKTAQEELLSQIKLKCIYAPITFADEVNYDVMTNSAVLLHDYTKQQSQTIIPRQQINDPLVETIAAMIPYARTAAMLSTGVKGVRVNDSAEAEDVMVGSTTIDVAAQTGNPWVPLLGKLDYQELNGGVAYKPTDFMQLMQSLDNFRLSTYGIDNGGLFEKKSQILESENSVNASNTAVALTDGLAIRQNFCNIVNSIWHLGIWCDVTETAAMRDDNGDGRIDENDPAASQSGSEGGNSDGNAEVQ